MGLIASSSCFILLKLLEALPITVCGKARHHTLALHEINVSIDREIAVIVGRILGLACINHGLTIRLGINGNADALTGTTYYQAIRVLRGKWESLTLMAAPLYVSGEAP